LAKRAKPKRPSKKGTNFKASLNNLLLNAVIFFLSALVIYLMYSLYARITVPEIVKVVKVDSSVPSSIIQVEVLNGCGVPKVGERFRDYLRHEGFDVVNVANYIKYDVARTMVIDRIGNIANAKEVAKSLGINPGKAFPQLNDAYFVDVTVVIGKDFNKLNPLKIKE